MENASELLTEDESLFDTNKLLPRILHSIYVEKK